MEVGEALRFDIDMSVSQISGTDAVIGFGFSFHDAAGVYISETRTDFPRTGTVFKRTHYSEGVVPAGASYARLWVGYIANGQATNGWADWYMDNILVTTRSKTMLEQYVVEQEEAVVLSRRAFTNYRFVGRAATTQSIFTLVNRAGSGRLARLKNLTLQQDSTATLTSVAAQLKLYRQAIPAARPSDGITSIAVDIVGGDVAPFYIHDTNEQPAQGGLAAMRQYAINTGAISQWRMEEASGTLPQDSIGTNHFNASVGTAVTTGNPSEILGEKVNVLRCAAGTESRIEAPHSASLLPTDQGWCYAFWYRITRWVSSATNWYVFAKDIAPALTGSPNNHMAFGIGANNTMPRIRAIHGPSGNTNWFGYGIVRSPSHWRLMVINKTPFTGENKFRIYMDGYRDNENGTALTSESARNNTNPFCIGNLTANGPVGVEWEMSHLTWWNRALTIEEVWGLYESVLPRIEVRTDGLGADGHNGAATSFDALQPPAPGAGSQLVADFPMRLHTLAEQINMSEIEAVDGTEPIIVREGEMLHGRLEAPTTAGTAATNHYLVNALVEEFIMP